MNQGTTDRILFALFCLSRDTRHIDAAELAHACSGPGERGELSVIQAAEALVSLERAGLVDASRARLTMFGLARAVALSRAGGGQPRVDLRHAQPRKEAAAAPLAAAAGTVVTNVREAAPEDRPARPRRRPANRAEGLPT